MQIIYHDDEEKAPQELQERRRSICNSCPNYTQQTDSCSECSCLISRRVYYLNITCPINKW